MIAPTFYRCRRFASWLLPLALSLGVSGSAAAQACLSISSRTLLFTASNCSGISSIDRALGAQLMSWNNDETQLLVVNEGNEIRIWNINNPGYPTVVDLSRFGVSNMGDSDYDLMNFSVCDGCEWGIANFWGGTVLFGLGDRSLPIIDDVNHGFYGHAVQVQGGFTFKRGETQYLIASGLPDACSNGDSTLYEFSGVDAAGLVQIGCVTVSPSFKTQIVGGIDAGEYLFLGDSSEHVFIMRVVEDSGGLSLQYEHYFGRAYMIRDKGLAIDLASGLAVKGNTVGEEQGLTIWDVHDPANPTLLSTVAGEFNRVAIRCHRVFAAKKGSKYSIRTFDISDPLHPVPLDQDFWNPDQTWNYPDNACTEPQGAVFSPDGSILYHSRYGILQLVETDACGGCELIFQDGFEYGALVRWQDDIQ